MSEQLFDVKNLAQQVLNWEHTSMGHSADGDIYSANNHPFMILREDRLFVRLDPEVQAVIREWPGIWQVHGHIIGYSNWVQVVASKTVQTGIRGLIRLAYEYALRPRGILL